MMDSTRPWFAAGILVCAIISASVLLRADESKKETPAQSSTTAAKGLPAPAPAQCSAAADPYFNEELWPKVVQRSCLTCHKEGGDAEDSEFVLQDPSRTVGPAQTAAIRQNHALLIRLAKLKDGDESVILQKVTGGLDHGGKEVLPRESIGYRTLAEFVRRTVTPLQKSTLQPAPAESALPLDTKPQPPLFAGVTMLDDRRLLRRVTLSLAGRLPTDAELETIKKEGLAALPKQLDALMTEEAFYARLREGFNDIFLTTGYGDGAESALAYDHFSKTRLWPLYGKIEDVPNETIRSRKKDEHLRDYRAGLLGEPMKLVEHIVRNDHPFTEIVTADYIMVTPYTALGYGVYDELKDKFADPADPFEYIPVKLKALVGREKRQNQESATGFYPHAGMLGMFQYLRRYPTTETNRNRLRARMYFQHFLGIDALELAARVSDAATAQTKFEIPTMQAAECVVCHKTIDPISSCFQDFYHFEGVYGRRKEGWYKDMYQAGFEGEDLPAEERWRALQWLGERTARDPRFAVAMVEHVYYILTGRKVLLPPKDLDDPQYGAKHRAYREQRCLIQSAAEHFAANKFNLKGVFKELILSDFYRADGLAPQQQLTDAQRAALDDIGVVRMLAPEQVERKIKAVFGTSWGKLNGQNGMLYGGIDSDQVTERASEPSGAMGSLQRTLANDVAAKNVLREFALPAKERALFTAIEPDILPGASPEADAKIRQQVLALHERVLGIYDKENSPDIERTIRLFNSLVQEAKAAKVPKEEIYYARSKIENVPKDPDYTIRAWRGVVTYLLRRHEFLYE